MPIAGVAAAAFDAILAALGVLILILTLTAVGIAIGLLLSQPLRLIPVVGGTIGNWLENRVSDMVSYAWHTVVSWWPASVNTTDSFAYSVGETFRIQDYTILNMTRLLAQSVAYIGSNALTGVSPTISTTIVQADNQLRGVLEQEINTAHSDAITTSEGYTYSIGQWAYAGFQHDEAAITNTVASLQQEILTREGQIAQTQTFAADIAGKAASAALTESQRELVQARDQLTAHVDLVESDLRGQITDVSKTQGAAIDALTANVNQFETGLSAYLIAHAIPAVAEIEKVGFKCLENLCGGLDGVASDFLDLENLFEIGAIAALIYGAIRAPEETAQQLTAPLQGILDEGVSLMHSTLGV